MSKDIAWLAGLVEGEGSIRPRKSNNKSYFQIKMTDKDVIEEAQRILKSNGIELNLRHRPSKTEKTYIVGKGVQDRPRKEQWELGTQSRTKLQSIISLLYPFFFEKKKKDCNEALSNLGS